MRVKCHGCHSGWEFPDDISVARCPSCRILAVSPPARSLSERADTSEPTDQQIIGLTGDVRGADLSAAWAAFLEKIPFDRFPAAFRQGRLAFDRLNAASESIRLLPRWPVAGRCLACDESERFGFRACVLCRGALRSGGTAAQPASPPRSSSPAVAEALEHAEALWRSGDLDQLLAAIDHVLARGDADDDARARFDLLAGHALASQGDHGDAIEHWSRAAAVTSASTEARFCLAALAYRRNLPEEALYHASRSPESETMRLIAGSALSGMGRADEAIERLSTLFASKNERLAARAHWAVAATEYAGGNPAGVFEHLRATISMLTGRRDEPALVESLAPIDIAKLHSHLVWLTGVSWSAIGHDELAESWLALGEQLAPGDPSFPRERGTIALRTQRLDAARELFDEVEKRGDAKGAARGRAVADWIVGGHRDAAPLLSAAELSRDPILFYHAGRQLERAGNSADAAKAYARATVLDPLMGRAFASLGVLHGREGDGERAISALRRARDAGERGTMVLKALATLLLERGSIVEAIPLLEEMRRRAPDDPTANRNFAGAKRLLALQYANDEKEEEALECLTEAAGADQEGAVEWARVAAEIGFRAATRLARSRPSGWESVAEELLDDAVRHDPGDLRIRLRLGVVRLARALSERSGDGLRAAIATLQSVASSPAASPPLRFSAELHRAIALLSNGSAQQADEIATRLAKNPVLDAESRLRARWVQALSLARAGKLLQSRVVLEESARECSELPEAAELLKAVRLEILKLQTAERGAHHLEREVQSIELDARGAPAQLYWAVALAGLGRWDEADRFFDMAALSPALRRDARAARTMMQLSRVAGLLSSRREAEAHKLLGSVRASLPQDPEIDRWLNSLEVEAVPVAALRQGNGAAALAIWSARAQRWLQKDAEYWELVRSIAIAAHAAATSAEARLDYAAAEHYWSITVTRWLELLDADEYWQSYSRRARELFPGLDPAIVDEIRKELVETHLASAIRASIALQRQRGEDPVALRRYQLLDQIESWRLSNNPADDSVRKRLAACHAQRLLLASKLERWDEALDAGTRACLADPADPAHFAAMAATYGAMMRPLLAELRANESDPGTTTPLFELTGRVVDLLSLGLAWNPHDRELARLSTELSIRLGYTGVPDSDPKVRRAVELREKLPPGALERYMEMITGEPAQKPEAMPAYGTIDVASIDTDDGGQVVEFSDVDTQAAMEMVSKWKNDGLSRDAIYWSLLSIYPILAKVSRKAVFKMVDAT
jgi:tetratricopeptide (TPR) repeat protein